MSVLPDCVQCGSSEQVVYQDAHVRVLVGGPMGLPFVARVVPRVHLRETDLDAATRRRIARTLKKIAAALRHDPAIAGFEFTDTGATAAHLQVLALARPTPGSYDAGTPLAFLNDLLPEVPADRLDARISLVVRALEGSGARLGVALRRRGGRVSP